MKRIIPTILAGSLAAAALLASPAARADEPGRDQDRSGWQRSDQADRRPRDSRRAEVERRWREEQDRRDREERDRIERERQAREEYERRTRDDAYRRSAEERPARQPGVSIQIDIGRWLAQR